jgi:uncharacterized protein YceK
MLKLLLTALLALAISGCASVRDYRAAPWDPKGHAQLFDPIPAWDRAAEIQCGAHLREKDRGNRSVRC